MRLSPMREKENTAVKQGKENAIWSSTFAEWTIMDSVECFSCAVDDKTCATCGVQQEEDEEQLAWVGWDTNVFVFTTIAVLASSSARLLRKVQLEQVPTVKSYC